MIIGVVAALLACFGYGVSSVLQAYGARRSAAAARDRGAIGHVTATGGPTLLSTIHAALTVAFIVGIVLDVVGSGGHSALAYRLRMTAAPVGAGPGGTAPLGSRAGTVTLTDHTVSVELAGGGLATGLHRLRGALYLYDPGRGGLPVSSRPRCLVDIDGGVVDVIAV